MVMVRKNLTGAGYGLTSWLQQRITAIIMLIVSLAFLGFIVVMAVTVDSNIGSWQKIFQCTFNKAVAQIFFFAVILHAWVGMRDIWMDYIQATFIKMTLHILTILWLVMSLIYSIKVIW